MILCSNCHGEAVHFWTWQMPCVASSHDMSGHEAECQECRDEFGDEPHGSTATQITSDEYEALCSVKEILAS